MNIRNGIEKLASVKEAESGKNKFLNCVLCKFLFPLLALLPLTAHSADSEQTPSESLEQLVDDHTSFAFSLYPELTASEGNSVFSPYSISTCLSMAYVGARSTTAQEMQQALKISFTPQEIALPSASLSEALLPINTKGYQLNLANALWLDAKSYILASYRYTIEKQFGAKLANIAFNMPDQALCTINNWVADQTKGQIQNLLMQNDISTSTRLLLTNAAYFKGSFLRPFPPDATREACFYSTPQAQNSILMMEQTAQFLYTENELFQAVGLPFVGMSKGKGQLALLLCLPKSMQNFDTMAGLMPDALSEALADLQTEKVHIQLPKFTLSKRYALNGALQQLGMKNPFTTQANFSGIDGRLNLYINQVVHETFFALDEFGVVAAAATAASMNMTSTPKPAEEFIADHPFLFFIIDLKSQEVLFMGKFSDPT
jgi:serpin B